MRLHRTLFILATFVISALLLASFFHVSARFSADALASPEVAQISDAPAAPESDLPAVRSSRRISIPYGFDSPLPLTLSGEEVVVSGPGACSAGEEVNVEVTISQTSPNAQAGGEWMGTCTGQLQPWRLVATVDTGPTLTGGLAEACGITTTRAGNDITDTFEWCAEVYLTTVQPRIYVPMSSGS